MLFILIAVVIIYIITGCLIYIFFQRKIDKLNEEIDLMNEQLVNRTNTIQHKNKCIKLLKEITGLQADAFNDFYKNAKKKKD